MPPLRKSARRKAPPPSRYETQKDRAPATIADLSPDVLLRTLSLTGQPARYASVCRRWNSLLAGSSEAWKECVLTSTHTQQPPDAPRVATGDMLGWLRPRCMSIESVTFKQFMTSRWDQDHGRAFLPFIAAAMGMLAAGSPLRALHFRDCLLAPHLLPQLPRLLTSCTSLHLHELASVADCYLQLSDLLKALPQLRELSATYRTLESTQEALPCGLTACGRLQSCQLVDIRNCETPKELTDSISRLSALTTLCTFGIYVNKVNSHVGRLTALQMLRMLRCPALIPVTDPLELPAEVAQLANSLRRLSFGSTAVPAEVTALQSLSRLSICGLSYTPEVGTQVAGLSVLTNIVKLRLHRCAGLQRIHVGLHTLLNALPKLEALALDHNNMTHTSLGHAAKRLTSLDLRGSSFNKEGLPASLRRAVYCRTLQLGIHSCDALTQGGEQPMMACPLLGMHSLQRLVFQQPVWQDGAMTAVLALQRCFHESHAFSGPGPEVVCRATPDTHGGLFNIRDALAESSDDEDDM